MLSEIQERIQDIIEGAAELETNPTVPKYLPAMLDDTDLPICLILPSNNSGFRHDGGNRYVTTFQFDLRLYISPIGVDYSGKNLFELLHYFDQFVEVFLSRPQLQWGGSPLGGPLAGIAGNLVFRNVSNLSRPISYPLGVSDAPLYWGSIYQLGIPFRTSYTIKPTGV